MFTLAYTGIRFGDAIALRASAVDIDGQRITVSHSATHVAYEGIVETDTKNHAARSVPIPEFLGNELRSVLDGLTPDARVFPGREGDWLSLGEFQWVFDNAAVSVGIAGVVPHGLRHTAASLAISAGANVKVVQRMLGHKTATLTLDLYGHLFPDDLDTVAAAMNAGALTAADELRTEIESAQTSSAQNGQLPAVS
ncbi:site-specific integrase [Nocardia sp. NPDC051981]|uniref:tyrosine-type recombinase/integrase n=1 Tax=Nocardia sp. NPDC051981 TaxID=3155417 RepID=UPI003442B28F